MDVSKSLCLERKTMALISGALRSRDQKHHDGVSGASERDTRGSSRLYQRYGHLILGRIRYMRPSGTICHATGLHGGDVGIIKCFFIEMLWVVMDEAHSE